MQSRITYFAAVKVIANVHIAWTRFQPDQYVHCDMTREEAFKLYQDSPEVVIFNNVEYANRYADKIYYAAAPRNAMGLFEDRPIKRSNNNELLDIYGEEAVRMKETPVTVLFQLSSDHSLEGKGEAVSFPDELIRGTKISGENKKLLTLDIAGVPAMLHLSDEVAARENSATTVNIMDHAQLTTRRGLCTIL